MTKDRAQNILTRLAVFAKLERQNTDEAGWIALAFSCSRARAARMITQARTMGDNPKAPTAKKAKERTPRCARRWIGPDNLSHVCTWHRNGTCLCPCGQSDQGPLEGS